MTGVSLITYPAADLAAAKTFFHALLNAEPYVDSPQYVGYKSGDVEIGLVPSAPREKGAVAYWDVPDIAASVKALEAAGGTIAQPVTDVGYGMLVASVAGPNGAIVGLRQPPKT